MVQRRAVYFFLTVGVFVSMAGPGRLTLQAQSKSKARVLTDVALVQIPVIVFDEKGAVATDLAKSDFRVLEDGVEQKILYCDKEREPVSFVILDDLSSSMTKKIPFVQEATLSVLDPIDSQDEQQDEFAVFGIGRRVKRLTPFLHDQRELQHRIPSLVTATNESTALFDGIYAGAAMAEREAQNTRRAMIIISDGGDNHSRYNLRETKGLLEESEMPVFAVMAGPSFEFPSIFAPKEKKPMPFPGAEKGTMPRMPNLPIPERDHIGLAERRGPHNLKTLTEVTGGGVFTARNIEDLPRIVRTISLAVRYRYLLTYKPPGGEWGAKSSVLGRARESYSRHKIHLELIPKDKFKGYPTPYYKGWYSRID
jgi:Ca-activated chloride channel family protein